MAVTDIAPLGQDRLVTEFSFIEGLDNVAFSTDVIGKGAIDFDGVDFDKTDAGMTERDLTEHSNQASDGAWQLQAACRSVPNAPEIFFSENLPDIVAAKGICAGCPAIAPCLEGAIGRAEPCGVWGGQLFLNGRVLAQKRRRGRPPKVARPEDQLPRVPVPDYLRELVAASSR